MNNDIYTKYGITNDNWCCNVAGTKANNVSLGGLIRDLYIPMGRMGITYTISKFMSYDVVSECTKLDNVGNYFYRNVIDPSIFKFKQYDKLDEYNSDPWRRPFPTYVNGLLYVNNIGNKVQYGYSVFYDSKVIRSVDIVDRCKFIENSIPLAILHTTSIEGVTVACIDIIH